MSCRDVTPVTNTPTGRNPVETRTAALLTCFFSGASRGYCCGISNRIRAASKLESHVRTAINFFSRATLTSVGVSQAVPIWRPEPPGRTWKRLVGQANLRLFYIEIKNAQEWRSLLDGIKIYAGLSMVFSVGEETAMWKNCCRRARAEQVLLGLPAWSRILLSGHLLRLCQTFVACGTVAEQSAGSFVQM